MNQGPMSRDEILERLRALHRQVRRTAEREEHLSHSLPFDIMPRSLNYDDDRARLEGEYNRLVRAAEAEGSLTAADLEAEGLSHQFPES